MQEDSPQKLSAALELLNARIARLAIGLGIDLRASDAIEKLMKSSSQASITVDRRKNVAEIAHVQAPASGERRIAHLQEELRGLVTLRYHIETLSVTENGLIATRLMVMQAHQHLLEQGFAAGVDGVTKQQLQDLNEPPNEKI